MSVTFVSAIVLASNLFTSRKDVLSKSIQILLKITNYLFYLIFLEAIINTIMSVLWRQTSIPVTVCFYLDVVLVVLLSLPMLYKLVIFEDNVVLRAISIFLFYYLIYLVPGNFKLGNTWFPDYSPVTLIAFILETSLVIFAMHKWGYRFPRLKLNKNINYWWLVFLVIPRFLVMGFSAGSWSRLLSAPLVVRLAVPQDMKGIVATITYVSFTILMTCFKEELIFRYLFLAQLFENQHGNIRKRVLKSALISSLLFGAWHLQNFNYQPVLSTLLQAFSAFAMGMVFSLICLYTGTIWITVIMHSVFDLFIVDKVISVSPLQSQPNAFMTEFMLLISVIQIGVTLIVIYKINSGPFEQTLHDNQFSGTSKIVGIGYQPK